MTEEFESEVKNWVVMHYCLKIFEGLRRVTHLYWLSSVCGFIAYLILSSVLKKKKGEHWFTICPGITALESRIRKVLEELPPLNEAERKKLQNLIRMSKDGDDDIDIYLEELRKATQFGKLKEWPFLRTLHQ